MEKGAAGGAWRKEKRAAGEEEGPPQAKGVPTSSDPSSDAPAPAGRASNPPLCVCPAHPWMELAASRRIWPTSTSPTLSANSAPLTPLHRPWHDLAPPSPDPSLDPMRMRPKAPRAAGPSPRHALLGHPVPNSPRLLLLRF
eukprot:scaffold63338_cov63-Phaeocystis_antarctica.AAC.1